MTQASAPTVTGWQTPATSPYQDRRWYAAAGLLDQVTVLAAGSDQRPVSLPVWRVEPDAHYYHVPRNLLGGHREAPFLAGGPIQPLELHARDWGQSLVTVSPYGYHGGPAHSTGSDPAALGEVAEQTLQPAKQHDTHYVFSHPPFSNQ
ncbi:MAG: hypothetical protein ACR2N4_10715, partial [Jatrophihabitans sp.]